MSSTQFNVSQLLKSDVGSTRSYEFESDVPFDLVDSMAHDISGRAKFTLTNFGIVATVQAHAVLDLTCARCLEPFSMPLDVDFEEEYQPSIDIVTGLPTTGPTSDTAFAISQNHTIDLGEAIRQHLVLAVELVPLCDQACRGLCATCGANLNTQACSCPPTEEQSPFAVLQELFSQPNVDKR